VQIFEACKSAGLLGSLAGFFGGATQSPRLLLFNLAKVLPCCSVRIAIRR
jgi:hypothetical protein